jgi:hypothetical protein
MVGPGGCVGVRLGVSDGRAAGDRRAVRGGCPGGGAGPDQAPGLGAGRDGPAGGGVAPGLAGGPGPGRPVRRGPAGREGEGGVPGAAQAGADRGLLVPVGGGDHPRERGPGAARGAEPARRAGRPAGSGPADRGPADAPGRREAGQDPRVCDRGRAAREAAAPARADGPPRPHGAASGGGGRVRGAGREGPAAQAREPGWRRADATAMAGGVAGRPDVHHRRRRGG